jgi:allophanate hydrolase
MSIMTGPGGDDPHERRWPADVRLAATSPTVAVPPDDQLTLLPPAALRSFHDQVTRLREAGAKIKTVDITWMSRISTTVPSLGVKGSWVRMWA